MLFSQTEPKPSPSQIHNNQSTTSLCEFRPRKKRNNAHSQCCKFFFHETDGRSECIQSTNRSINIFAPVCALLKAITGTHVRVSFCSYLLWVGACQDFFFPLQSSLLFLNFQLNCCFLIFPLLNYTSTNFGPSGMRGQAVFIIRRLIRYRYRLNGENRFLVGDFH